MDIHLTPGEGPARVVAISGRPWGQRVVVTARDATSQHELEEEVRALRRFEALGLVTASVVHDLNNVLAGVLGLTALLKVERDAAHTEALADDLHAIVMRGAGLMNRVLGLVRHRSPTTTHVDVSAAVAELVPLIERFLGDGTELVVDLAAARDDIRLDRERFDQVVLNLVANARDAMTDGGRLTISTRDVSLPPAPGSPGFDFVALSIADTGTGMSDEVAARAFERFFTTKPPGHGTGLGLPGVQRFVAECGGRISLATAPGAGTTVSLYLPRLPRSERTTAPPPSPAR
jgi:signal transduction histidine kinase